MADTLARIDDLGGHRAYNHYPWGWAWAGNTPLRLWKRYTWLGGVRTPLVVHWPAGMAAAAAARSATSSATPSTCCRRCSTLAASEPPASVDGVDQLPLDGASLRPTFDDAGAPERPARPSTSRSSARARSYHDGWKATTDHVGAQLTVERGRWSRQPRLRRPTGGRCSTSTTTSPRPTTSPTSTPTWWRARALWWARGRPQPGAAARRQPDRPAVAMEPHPPGPAVRRGVPPGRRRHRRGLPARHGRRLPADRRRRGARRRGAGRRLRPRRLEQRLGVVPARRPPPWRSACSAADRGGGPGALAAGAHGWAVTYEAEPAGGGPLAPARRRHGRSAEGTASPRTCRSAGRSAAPAAHRHDAGFPVCDDYRPPFCLPARSTTWSSSRRPSRARRRRRAGPGPPPRVAPPPPIPTDPGGGVPGAPHVHRRSRRSGRGHGHVPCLCRASRGRRRARRPTAPWSSPSRWPSWCWSCSACSPSPPELHEPATAHRAPVTAGGALRR